MAMKKIERKPLIQPGTNPANSGASTVAPKIQPIVKPLIQPTTTITDNQGEEEMTNMEMNEEMNYEEYQVDEFDNIDEMEQPQPTNFARPTITPAPRQVAQPVVNKPAIGSRVAVTPQPIQQVAQPVQTPQPIQQVAQPVQTPQPIQQVQEPVQVETQQVATRPVAKTKATGGKKVTAKVVNSPIKSTSPDDIVVAGQVTKREDLMKLALNHLRKMDMDMSIESMSLIYKCLEKAIEDSVSRGGAVVFLGNQIQLKEKGQRVASVPNQNYDTLTFPYQAMQWSKLGDRTTVRGSYDQESKVFTCQDGSAFQL